MDAVQTLRRYVFGFVNSHDFDVCRRLMSEDYVLHTGQDLLVGREEDYIPAVRHQIEQFPQLGFAVHDLVTDGEWTALLFSEHRTTTPAGVRRRVRVSPSRPSPWTRGPQRGSPPPGPPRTP